MDEQDRSSEIREALMEQLRHRPCAGSYLGLTLRKKFPDLKIREEYGGLRQFVREYASGQIQIRRNPGADDIFSISGVSAPPQAVLASGSSNARAWHALTRPNDRDIAAVNPTTGEIAIVASDAQVPAGYHTVNGLTDADYRAMARDFIATLGSNSTTQQLEGVLAADSDFWTKWVHAVNVAGVGRDWGKFRINKLDEIVNRKFTDVGVSSAEARAIWSRLRMRPSRISQTRSIQQSEMSGDDSSTTPPGLRDIARIAIEHIGESELREIRLPLGAVVDALNALRKR